MCTYTRQKGCQKILCVLCSPVWYDVYTYMHIYTHIIRIYIYVYTHASERASESLVSSVFGERV